MVVDEAAGLQIGMADGGTEKSEAPFFHVPAHGFGFGGGDRNFAQCPEMVDNRFFAGKKGEDIVMEAAEFFLQGEKQSGVCDGRCDFQAVSDDTVKLHEPFDVFAGHLRNPCGIEIAKRPAVSLPFPEDGEPVQSGLGAFQHEKFEQCPLVRDGFSPFLIVVLYVKRVCRAPAAAAVDQILFRHERGSGFARGLFFPGDAGFPPLFREGACRDGNREKKRDFSYG